MIGSFIAMEEEEEEEEEEERESGAMISPITKVETMLLSIILDRRIQQLVVCFKLRIYGRGIMELKYVRHGPSLGWTVLVDL